MKVVVTGGAGFIGSAVCRLLIEETDTEIVNLDKLTYAASLDVPGERGCNPRYAFAKLDICDAAAWRRLLSAIGPTR